MSRLLTPILVRMMTEIEFYSIYFTMDLVNHVATYTPYFTYMSILSIHVRILHILLTLSNCLSYVSIYLSYLFILTVSSYSAKPTLPSYLLIYPQILLILANYLSIYLSYYPYHQSTLQISPI